MMERPRPECLALPKIETLVRRGFSVITPRRMM